MQAATEDFEHTEEAPIINTTFEDEGFGLQEPRGEILGEGEQETRTPEEVLDAWFGSEDAATIEFSGVLTTDPHDQLDIHIDGAPLRDLLDSSAQPYYDNVFLPDLFRGTATWSGATTPTGDILEGTVARRVGATGVEFLYGRRAAGEGQSEYVHSSQTETFTAPHRQENVPSPTVELQLDELLSNSKL